MKIRKSENTTTQESQESQNTTKGPKGGGKGPRGVNASADSVEMSSAAKGKAEASGQRVLTADEQAMVPKIDPENFTSLQSGTDPRAALEGSKPFSQYKQPSPRGSSTMPNGQSGFNAHDLSQYNVQTNSAPSLDLKGAMGQVGSRGEKLKALAGNKTDMLNPFEAGKSQSQGGRSYMNVKDGELENAWNWVKQKLGITPDDVDDVKAEVAEQVLEGAIDKAGKTGSRVLPVLGCHSQASLRLRKLALKRDFFR